MFRSVWIISILALTIQASFLPRRELDSHMYDAKCKDNVLTMLSNVTLTLDQNKTYNLTIPYNYTLSNAATIDYISSWKQFFSSSIPTCAPDLCAIHEVQMSKNTANPAPFCGPRLIDLTKMYPSFNYSGP